ncbi:MAG: serine/threonine protein kinase [Kofleriaceae bacterium]|nr:serine/threonine protein kinase [Kofleriaceae bacterium]
MLNPLTFGKYRLLSKIAAGSLGEVFRASVAEVSDSPAARPTLALKRLLPTQVGKPDITAVFEGEIEISRHLRHPRLLGAIDSGSVDGWPFLVSPLADDGSLRDLLECKGVLTPAQLSSLATDLGEALDAMHALGYTHGDLNPGNIVYHEDRAHLIDFSAGTAIAQRQIRPLGSYAYMSPEQVRGEPLDARSDVFACAALLWQCATGVKPFARSAQHLTFMAVVESEPPPMPEEFAALEIALRPALAKEPAGRPTTVSELCAHFREKL